MIPAGPSHSFLQHYAFGAAFSLLCSWVTWSCSAPASLHKLQWRPESHTSRCDPGTWYKASNLSVPSTHIAIAGSAWFLSLLLLLGFAGMTQRYPQKLLQRACEVMGPDPGSRAALAHPHRHNCGVIAWDRRSSGRDSCRLFEGTRMLKLVMCSVAVVRSVMNVSKIL